MSEDDRDLDAWDDTGDWPVVAGEDHDAVAEDDEYFDDEDPEDDAVVDDAEAAYDEDEDYDDEDEDEDAAYDDEADPEEVDEDGRDAWVAVVAASDGPGGPFDVPDGPTGPTGGAGDRRRGGRAARVIVLLVLLGLLAGGIALERRGTEAAPARVTTAGLDGPEIPLDDAVSTAWYCAAGTATPAGDADETVVVANLSPVGITATVTVYPGGGAEARSEELRMRPYERLELPVADVLTSESPGVIVEVAGGAAVVEHELRGAGDLATSACSRAPSNRWYFAAGGTQRGRTQRLELFNPFGDDAIVDIAFLTEGGVQEPQSLQGFVVPRRSKVIVPVTELVDRQERVATVVHTRTGRVVADQVRVFDGTDGTSGLALSLGTARPRREWTLPMVDAGPDARGTVAIANFGLTPTRVEVSVLLGGEGVLTPETIDLPSRSVVHFDPSDRVPAGESYAVVVRSQTSSPIVAEALSTAPGGAATATGASIAARRWALAGSPDRASSVVVATNRGATPLTVELLAYTDGDPDSPRSAPAVVVAPGKSARFDLDERGIDPDQVLVVSADGPIVVGRETVTGGVALSLGVPFRD